jgi:hypothetical protein
MVNLPPQSNPAAPKYRLYPVATNDDSSLNLFGNALPSGGEERGSTQSISDTIQQVEEPHPERCLARTVRIMRVLRAEELFGTPVKAKEFINSLDYGEFKRYLDFVNGVERGIPLGERGQVSSSIVQSSSILFGTSTEYQPPHKEHRKQLLEMAFNKAKEVEDPQMAALTLGLAINAVHYFADGNGRTARMVYSLLSKGYDGSGESQEYYSGILENGKGREIVNPNPALSRLDKIIKGEMFKRCAAKYGFGDSAPSYVDEGYDCFFAEDRSPENLKVSDAVGSAERRALHEVLSSGWSMVSLMIAFSPERVNQHLKTDPNTNHKFLDGDLFIPTLSDSEIQNWYFENYRVITSYVLHLINVSDRPDAEDIAAIYSRSRDD